MKSKGKRKKDATARPRRSQRSTYVPGSCTLPTTSIKDTMSTEFSPYRRKLRENAKISGTLVLITLGLVAYSNVEVFPGSEDFAIIIQAMIGTLCIGQSLLVYQCYLIKLKERKARKEICLYSTLWQDTSLLKRFIPELMISVVFKPPFLCEDLKDLFLVLCISKYYLFFKALVELSPRNTERTNFYCRQFNSRSGVSFILKCYINDLPFFFVAFLWAFSLFNFALITNSFESTNITFYESFWLSGVTQTTVGYGDLMPVSELGQVFCGLNAVFGSLILSLSLMFIRNYLELSQEQENFYKDVMLIKINLDGQACCFIQSWWRYLGKYRKKEPRLSELHKYMVSYFKFKKARLGPLLQEQTSFRYELSEADCLISKQFELFHTKLRKTKDIEAKAKASKILASNFAWKIHFLGSGHFSNYSKNGIKTTKGFTRSNWNTNQSKRVHMKRKRDIALKKHISKSSDTLGCFRNATDSFIIKYPSSNIDI